MAHVSELHRDIAIGEQNPAWFPGASSTSDTLTQQTVSRTTALYSTVLVLVLVLVLVPVL
jgi:hypothetical protein